MAFSLAVEMVNLRVRKSGRGVVELRKPYSDDPPSGASHGEAAK
jgi:hypothetical protein